MKNLRYFSLIIFGSAIIAPAITLSFLNTIHWAQFILPSIAVVCFFISFMKKEKQKRKHYNILYWRRPSKKLLKSVHKQLENQN